MVKSQASLQGSRGGEFAIWNGCDRNRWKRRLALRKSRGESLIRGNDCGDCTVGCSGRYGCTPHAAKHSSLKRLVVGRIRADQIRHCARQDIAENSEASAEHRFRLELPRNRRSRLQNSHRRGREQIAEVSLNKGFQWLSVRGNRTEGAAKTGDLIMRIRRIGVECVAQAKRPSQSASHFPGVLRVDVDVEKVEGLI